MKKIFKIVLVFLLSMATIIPFDVKATNDYYETFEDECYKYTVSLKENMSQVIVEDLETKQLVEFSYDVTDGYIRKNGEIIGTVKVSNPLDFNNKDRAIMGPYGPYKVDFSIDVEDVAFLVSAIIAIPAMITAATNGGISLAVLKAGFESLKKRFGESAIYVYLLQGFKVEGDFTFYQEWDGTRCRNVDRSCSLRFGNESEEKRHYFDDGGWFDTQRPYGLEV